jgi:hypothetical protein
MRPEARSSAAFCVGESAFQRDGCTQQASLPSRTDLMSPVDHVAVARSDPLFDQMANWVCRPHHRRRVGRSRGSPAWGPFGPAPAFTRVVTVPGRKGRRNRNHHDHGAEKQILHDALPSLGILPPLIYAAGVAMSWREFRFNLRPIALFAFGCVVVTTCAVAGTVHWLLAMPLAVSFVPRDGDYYGYLLARNSQFG